METGLSSRSALDPGLLGKGSGETLELEESSPPGVSPRGEDADAEGGSQGVPGRSVPGIRFRPQGEEFPHKRMSPPNPWTRGGGTVPQNAGVHWPVWSEEEEKPTQEESTGDGMECSSPLCRLSLSR